MLRVSVFKPSAAEDAENDIATTVKGIYTFRRNEFDEPDDVGVVIEGVKVLSNVESVILAFRSQLPRQPEIHIWVSAENPYESGWTQGQHQNIATEDQAVHVKGGTGDKWQWV